MPKNCILETGNWPSVGKEAWVQWHRILNT